MFENINEIAVLITAILAVAIGSIWYSPLAFGSIWMRSIGIQPGDEVMEKHEMYKAIFKGVVNQAIFFFVVATLVVEMGEAISMWKFAGALLVLFATQMYSAVLWEKKPIAYFLVNIGYVTFVLLAGLAVITYWPW